MNYIGYIYFKGKGVEKNYEEAIKWYKKAIKLGNKEAIYNLENLLKEMNNMDKNNTTVF